MLAAMGMSRGVRESGEGVSIEELSAMEGLGGVVDKADVTKGELREEKVGPRKSPPPSGLEGICGEDEEEVEEMDVASLVVVELVVGRCSSELFSVLSLWSDPATHRGWGLFFNCTEIIG